jgi:hypothetical protein
MNSNALATTSKRFIADGADMKKLIKYSLIPGLFFLAGCSRNIDGTYVAMPLLFVIEGEKAALAVPQTPVYKVKLDGKRVTLYARDLKEPDSMEFEIVEDGEALFCGRCPVNGIPAVWRKLTAEQEANFELTKVLKRKIKLN